MITPSNSRWKRRTLGYIFAGLVAVDLYGYAGENGAKILRSNDFTDGAAPYYQGFGKILNFGWRSLKDMASEINTIVQRKPQP